MTQPCIAAYVSDGNGGWDYDNTFTSPFGVLSGNIGIQIHELSTGEVIVAGTFSGVTYQLFRLNANGGVLSYTKFENGQLNKFVVSETNNQIICVGDFTQVINPNLDGSYFANGIVALNLSTGYVDESFVYGSGFTNSEALDVIETSFNRYMVGGTFTSYNDNSVNFLTRLNSDGSIDGTFSALVFSGDNRPTISKILELSDGSFYVSGRWARYDGVVSYDNIFISSSGILDTDYLSQTQSTEIGSGFVIDSLQYNNKLISVGSYDSSAFRISNTIRYGQYALYTKIS
jgi:hypothetical protein